MSYEQTSVSTRYKTSLMLRGCTWPTFKHRCRDRDRASILISLPLRCRDRASILISLQYRCRTSILISLQHRCRDRASILISH